MKGRLIEKDRIRWAEEECERLSRIEFERKDEETAFLNVKGSRDLDGIGLAILKRIFDFRAVSYTHLTLPTNREV